MVWKIPSNPNYCDSIISLSLQYAEMCTRSTVLATDETLKPSQVLEYIAIDWMVLGDE